MLREIGCITTSMILGIGTIKRNWRLFKTVNFVQSDTTSTLKGKHQALVYGTNKQLKERLPRTRLSSSARFCNDDNFKGWNMDKFCGDIIVSLETSQYNANGGVRVFHTWV